VLFRSPQNPKTPGLETLLHLLFLNQIIIIK
jgi:hypothetical protein